MDRYLAEGVWRTEGREVGSLQEWVETHWNPSVPREAPAGTAAEAQRFERQGETQLNAAIRSQARRHQAGAIHACE